mgnify:CR=1 FL=1
MRTLVTIVLNNGKQYVDAGLRVKRLKEPSSSAELVLVDISTLVHRVPEISISQGNIQALIFRLTPFTSQILDFSGISRFCHENFLNGF